MNAFTWLISLSILVISLNIPAAHASEPIPIPSNASDSYACTLIEKEHARGIEIWRANRLPEALERFKACEEALKKRRLWAPADLPDNPTAMQRRFLAVTNQVVFSLAAIHQKLGNRVESEQYAEQARRRGILPKVFLSGRKSR